MSSDYDKARAHAQLLIRDAREEAGGKLTSEMIGRQVDLVLSIKPAWQTTVNRDSLIRDLETMFSTWIGEARTLDDVRDHVPWLHERRGEIDWQYWNRYGQMLQESGWADATINRLVELTDEILSRLENPLRQGRWDTRGMIVGHVQSGKTANYIGLICKAADAGYKLIIILTGMHNNLRSQTQMRLDEGFLGYDSTRNLIDGGSVPSIGVGEIDPSIQRPDTITTRLENGDFRREVANHFNISPGGHPLLFVVKKNGSVLRNLLEWVEWASNSSDENGRRIVSSVPLLVIDDECDWGSIDTTDLPFDENGEPDLEHIPTVLNQRIRRLLFSFDQSTYIGYTATPFANIFIHEKARTTELGDDLFPRNFIMALPAPSNYIGPAQIFGLDEDTDPEVESRGVPVVRIVTDHAMSDDVNERQGWIPPRHNRTHVPRYEGQNIVPPSLHEAIHAFVLVCAARIARGQRNAHNSMLVHVTRFNDVQHRVYDQVCVELANIQNRLRRGEGNTLTPLIKELRTLWEQDFIPTTEAINDPDCYLIPWEEIKKHLLKAAAAIQVRQINGSAGDVLDYAEHRDTGLNVIAIGGDKLSRGLTLEGLSVSYFLRASRMYDTLMQMGRWFGYRPSYVDLCRLYTTEDIIDWFRHITIANAELRREFDRMVAVGGTPRDYGHRVRSHPQLLVTSQVKMRHGVSIELSFSNAISETIVFYRDENTIRKNYGALLKLLSRMGTNEGDFEKDPVRTRPGGKVHSWKGSFCWTGVSAGHIRQFLMEYSAHPKTRRVNCSLLAEYIERQNENGDLTEWTVLLLVGEGNEHRGLPVGAISLINRSWHPNVPVDRRVSYDRYVIRRLVSGRDEAIDIDATGYAKALQMTRDAWTMDKGRSRRDTPPNEPEGEDIRKIRPKSRGVLLIYPLDPDGKSEEGGQGLPITGFAISFPGNPDDKKVAYIVNNVYYQQEYGQGV